ncbi:FAD:protein FMN transferase [Halochromatium glycolicum]|uniref:FAD:protein FMN transferase n=1 Tax=Halochromatium glycolicum TaxID=85075 RepID=A0AAJ0U0Q8_9GAMM|nr:FAD:protein FMN transferase [Halochromatium glycolicum]MBK1703194.1 thiamine biosynthesis protein ApbE [Halochromatium glycolicum]
MYHAKPHRMHANQGNGRQPLSGWPMALIATVAYVLLTGCGSESPAVTSRFTAFGEIVDISLVQVRPDTAKQAIRSVREGFEALEEDLNTWADGQMARVNQLLPTGEAFEAPVGILPLIHLSQRYADLSDNRFNPACGKLNALWGFNVAVPEGMRPPPSHAIEQLLEADARMSDVEVDILTLKGHNPALRLDFSAINQAYAIDLAIARLRELNIRHAQIKTGSDLRAIGNRSGQPWRVPIRRGSGAGVLAILDINGEESIVTRAVHDRNWLHDGVLYHSILDPRTGRPVRHTQSVTVVHPEAAVAAAAANALFVAGPQQWHALARTLGIQYALLVDSEGTVHLNPEFYDRIQLIDDDIPLEISQPLSPSVAS